MGRDAAQTEDGRYRLLVEAVTDYAIWVLILIVSHNLGLRASSRRGIGVRQIGPQRNFGSFEPLAKLSGAACWRHCMR